MDANAAFEGQVVGALERLESGGALRILDALFVASDEASGELFAIDLHGGTGGGLIARFPAGSGDAPAHNERSLKDAEAWLL